MYVVTINNGEKAIPIHNSKETLSSGKITKGINAIDSFQFAMLPSNAGFNEIYDYTTFVKVYNESRNRYEFYGRVLYSEDEMSESGAIKKEVICESYMGFFCDSQQEYVEERNWRVGELLEHIVNTHNSQVERYKQFIIGEVTVTDPNDNVYCGIQRENTWETLKKKLIDVLGGELQFRVVGDNIYLDYLTEIGEKSATKIALSRNLKSIVREKDPTAIVTRLIPLGAKRKAIETDGEGNETEVETEYRIDITTVNDGKNYVDDELAISIYGIRVGVVEWDDVENPSNLMLKGEQWLKENNKIQVSYTITALDLSLLGLDADDFEVCNWHTVKNPLLGINDDVRIIKKSIDVCDPTKSSLEFGDNFETLTEAMKRQSDALGLITSNYVTNRRFVDAIAKTSSLIEQTESKIRLEVTAQYTDLSETVSSIQLDVDSIDLSVKNGIDLFGQRVTAAESSITLLQDEIELKVTKNEFNELGGRVTTAESNIEILSDKITSTVTKTEFNELEERVTTAESQITQTPDYISSYVRKDELSTLVKQDAEAVQIAWNNISNYIAFEGGQLKFYTSEDQTNADLLCAMTNEGSYYYHDGAKIGKIGIVESSSDGGAALAFTLENGAHSMVWTYVEDEQAGTGVGTAKLMYSTGNGSQAEGIHLLCPTYGHNNLYISEDVFAGEFDGGAGGLYSDSADIAFSSQGSFIICGSSIELYSGSTSVDLLCDIDMCGNEILNQSDARLKKGIAETAVKALDVLSQIEMKQFEWIESGERCDIGIIAQQLREVAPALVHENAQTGRLSIKINQLIPYLIKAVQELAAKEKAGKWIDPYTAEEKAAFTSANTNKRKLDMKKGKGLTK